MPDVQVAVRLRWEARLNMRISSRCQILVNFILDEVLLAALAAVTEFAGNEEDEAIVMDELAARKRQKLRELRQRAKKGGESPKNSGEESEN